MPSVKVPAVRRRPVKRPFKALCMPAEQVRPPQPVGAPRSRTAAVVLAAALLLPWVGACEYTYEEGWYPPEEEAITSPATAQQQTRRRGPPAVSAEQMQAWASDALPGASGEVVHRSVARLDDGEVRAEDTRVLAPGTYSVAVACRSVRRVDFLVRNQDSSLIDLRLLCGPAQVNVLQLPDQAVLSLRVRAEDDANITYRIILL